MNMDLKPGLYIVSTPIGNLDDITLRAIDTLRNSHVIVCEDTRVSNKLLAKHRIKSPLLVYNDKSNKAVRDRIITCIKDGKVVSLISDAGTPLISDPGYKLVCDIVEEGIYLDIVPGVSAPIAALTLSTLPTDHFYFGGFLPKGSLKRQKLFATLRNIEATLIFFDTAPRLADSLCDAAQVLGARQAVVARELTKLFQEAKRGSLQHLKDFYMENTARGEIILLISGKSTSTLSFAEIEVEITNRLQEGQSARDISSEMAALYSKECDELSRSNIYKLANKAKKGLEK